MSEQDEFILVEEHGWRMGLSNMVRKEFTAWFGSSAWWKQALIWSVVLSAIVVSGAVVAPEIGLMMFVLMGSILMTIATIIASQEFILEEKRTGSVAWVLSKPLSRTSFIVAKLFPNAINLIVSLVFIPGAVVFSIIFLISGGTTSFTFFLGLVPLALWVIFLQFFTICLGTFFEKEGEVMGPPFFMMILLFQLGQMQYIGELSPFGLWILAQIYIGGASSSMTFTPSAALPIGTTIVATLVIIAILALVSIWRFKRVEF
ncbi:MAG: ABC transporter permease subunit [Candidatus Thorarchaeota archaeon]|jgi:ABC-2 type transport system permease protein